MAVRRPQPLMAFISGHYSGKALRWHTLLMLGVFGGLVTAALYLFDGYTFFDYSMSSLGAWHKNPAGWWLFSVAMWAMGVLVVPFFMHVARVFDRYTPRMARLFRACALATAASMVLLGFFPESPGTDVIHYAAAGFIFGGFLAVAFISWAAFTRMAKVASDRRRKVVITLSLVIMVPVFMVVILGMGSAYLVSRSAFLSSIYFWEWYYLVVCIGLYFLLTEVVVSREPAL
ncbi:MAG: DUF998 domain-containing protein [Candidatus Lokiarchaeota archaeon]|nr:DUF998 domain-containing protein [Candidatus Lokiarchaeota archaeon]